MLGDEGIVGEVIVLVVRVGCNFFFGGFDIFESFSFAIELVERG